MSPAKITTTEWTVGGLLDTIGTVGLQVAAWNHFQYPSTAPKPGEHKPDAVRAGRAAIEEIDAAIGELHALRVQLSAELHTDERARAHRVDDLVAKQRMHRDAPGRKAAAAGDGS